MARRRTWTIVGVAVVLVAAGLTTWTVATAPPLRPLHFWTKAGESPVRLYDAPGGREVTTWRAIDFAKAGSILCTSEPTLPERMLAKVGLRPEPKANILAGRVDRDTGAPDWSEYLVTIFVWPEWGTADSSLVGLWHAGEISGLSGLLSGDWRLDADGTAHTPLSEVVPCRWSRVGDVLLLGSDAQGRTASITVLQVALISADGESFEVGPGKKLGNVTYTRVR